MSSADGFDRQRALQCRLEESVEPRVAELVAAEILSGEQDGDALSPVRLEVAVKQAFAAIRCRLFRPDAA